MNDQVMPNSAGGGERPARVQPEGLQAVPTPEAAPTAAGPELGSPEVAPAPGASPAAASAQTTSTTPPPKLSRDQVAAAIAALPGGAPPPALQSGVPIPAAAGDVDVIEPEWVTKADDVIKTHQGDPYSEEEGIEQLQQDYLQKRYGISVKGEDDMGGSGSKSKGA